MKDKSMSELEYMGNPSEGVNWHLREGLLGKQSNWEAMQKQQAEDSITDICILFTRCIRKSNGDYTTPLLAENIIGGYKATPLGKEVALVIENAKMGNCKIVQYSINAIN